MKRKHFVTPTEFEKILPTVCTKETSYDQDGLTPENSLYGHCTVVALLAQDFFGGTILRASLKDIPELKHMRFHYWNKLSDGSIVDFTKAQFSRSYPQLPPPITKSRQYLLSYPKTMKRYKILAARLRKILK